MAAHIFKSARVKLCLALLAAGIISWLLPRPGITGAPAPSSTSGRFQQTLRTLSSYGDRSTGTPGNQAAADYIFQRFKALGFEDLGTHAFLVPVRVHGKSTLSVPDKKLALPIQPLNGNAVSPGTVSPGGLQGPLVYVGAGELKDFNGKDVAGAIILMELDSGKNWLHAANLGAKGLIYIDRGKTSKTFLKEKFELSPIRFPRFWLPFSIVKDLFGPLESAPAGRVSPEIQLTSEISWQNRNVNNIYCLIPGTDPELKEQLVIVEAFYDSTAMIAARSPGAGEAVSLTTLLELADALKQTPPQRSVLLVATNGHAQTLAGMREMIWSIRSRSKDLRQARKDLRKAVRDTRKIIKLFKKNSIAEVSDEGTLASMRHALTDRIKTEVDILSRKLMRLRMQEKTEANQKAIKALAQERLVLRRLGWRKTFESLSAEEQGLMDRLIPQTIADQQAILSDVLTQEKQLKSARRFRSLVRSREVQAVISLHLSSNGDGIGAFNEGWLYPLKETINRVSAYSLLDETIRRDAAQTEQQLNLPRFYKDTLRPSRIRPWQSYFIDRPPMGGEVSALAGYLGLSLATVHDARPLWGTPDDVFENVNLPYAVKQSAFVCTLIRRLLEAPALHSGIFPRNGFATVTGRAKFMRHGELFADQPAPESLILAYQGPGRYYALVDHRGLFQLKGVADKKHVLHKVIIEGYRFDPKTGSVIWAIDKKKTGKNAYRVKMQRRHMETDLVMFACRGITLFNLLEPRTFNYMTKVQLIDARREAAPLRYWYSRIDTRSSIITSVYLEPGTRLKITLSDSVIQRKMILTNSSTQRPEGSGFLVDQWPFIYRTAYQTAKDMWTLLAPRITNLENRGIFNEKIRELQNQGLDALNGASRALDNKMYDQFSEAAAKSWALATRVYNHVEKTQKDVLFGVLFYIALFVPFAFCLERLVFCYSNIYKRIIAFGVILILLVAVIYKVHPAFQLAYSPMVVILAFFIMGLSLMVTLIIFFRFEEEMVRLQRQSKHAKVEELSRWKAFVASFFLGVSNLRRRRLRTVLTCATLIILTFTIMSFTSVKSLRHHARLLLQDHAPYQGFLLKNFNWNDLPPEALDNLSNTFSRGAFVAPRVWLESDDRTQPRRVMIRFHGRMFEAQGLIGLSASEEKVMPLDHILTGGRWLSPTDRDAVLLPQRMAADLGIDPKRPQGATILMWGMPFEVVGTFSGRALQSHLDLDGEPLTPVTFPSETSLEMTEVEMEALESGEDIQTFQSRYQHTPADLTLIVPYQTLMAAGGRLKGVAVRPASLTDLRSTAENLVDRFGLMLFCGEPGGSYLYNASDTLSYSGVPNILIPLIISVFIVLNTMIGSVYERKREIGIYTSVGLAPSHVGFLFIAEAMAFAVLSVVLGYLLAQVSASLFAGSKLWSGITVNYSSLAGVAAMLLVILVVLVSVIYPSRVAAEIAIPDVNRSWSLPQAVDNSLEVTLPFLMKYEEHRSIGGFIYDYFKSHQDVSHGIFSTGDIDFAFVCPTPPGVKRDNQTCEGDACCFEACLQLFSKVWLAPFDFGIMQQVDIQFCPAAEESGYLEIKIRLKREAGEANAWRRINKSFLHDLRKQLLLWRSLDGAAQDYYEKLLASAQNFESHATDQGGPA